MVQKQYKRSLILSKHISDLVNHAPPARDGYKEISEAQMIYAQDENILILDMVPADARTITEEEIT